VLSLSGTRSSRGSGSGGLNTLVVGAGEAGRTLARSLRRSPNYGLRPIGFIDDAASLVRVAGLPVHRPISALAEIARAHNAEACIVAIPSLPAPRLAAIIESARAAGLHVRYLPSFLAALEREARLSDLRQLRVEDLLGRRELHVVSRNAANLISGRKVLVTGAGGSIGSELSRQIRSFGPQSLHLLDHDESNLHGLQLAIMGNGLLDSDEIVIADIRDQRRIDQVFEDVKPELVFHAAAHKHLPLLERHPCEAVKSNVLGTQNLVEAAARHGVSRFILISTDKAADPASVLGASKRLAELVVQHAAGGPVILASVRFGNVLGSRGSFLSVLADQIARGEPITVTHPDVTRFFMTVEEAVGLVLEAAAMAEYAETFVLDMGEPVGIVKLVKRYAEQMNLPDIEIRFTGLRPGEKLSEKVFSDAEQRVRSAHPKIWATRRREPSSEFEMLLKSLYAAADDGDATAVRQLFRELMPEYEPSLRPETPVSAGAPYPDGF
jgi:FlaA1/EpsC-like NDP-sugar epimerase